jgi:Putative transposase/Transposase zinc-binding domain
MKYRHPLKRILTETRSFWDHDGTRDSVRRVFASALTCRTAELGAEVYASDSQEFVHYHTCKSRACTSCGNRASIQWRRERWVALPTQSYHGITFSMPDVLWPLFRDNPTLAKALPALAAGLIQAKAATRHGLRVGVMAILHTFNGRLEFNSHVHTMSTAGGLHDSYEVWVRDILYDKDALMRSWRRAVIAILRAAAQARQLITRIPSRELEQLLGQQENRWWSINIQSFQDKQHFLKYAGRYTRRPPIAEHRISLITERTVTFWYKDKKLHRKVEVQCSKEEFVERWAQHILDRYKHSVRSFGLLAPRAISGTANAIFAVFGQKRRPRPKSLSWAWLMNHTFRRNPLLDRNGNRMKWVRRIPPKPVR